MRLLKSIKKSWASELVEPLILLIAWRIWIQVFALLGVILLAEYSQHFFGGGFDNYLSKETFLGWSNFDGEHYISLSQKGYGPLEHAFFPLYPLLIHLTSERSLASHVSTGIAISHLSFIAAVTILVQILKLDKKNIRWTLVALLLFPASFFFAAVYTESLYLFLSLLSFFFARKKCWLLAGLVGALASSSRVFGILLLPALLLEWYQQKKEEEKPIGVKDLPVIVCILLTTTGLISYSLYLFKTVGDPVSFYTEQSSFAQNRVADRLIVLPQVFWRYAKIITTMDKSSPLFLTVIMEVSTAILAMVLLWYGWITRVRWSYLFYAAASFILPTLTGTLTSWPRYMLTVFPFYILIGSWLSERSFGVKILVISSSVFLLALGTMLFIRGYWIS